MNAAAFEGVLGHPLMKRIIRINSIDDIDDTAVQERALHVSASLVGHMLCGDMSTSSTTT